jgi:flavin reductase (DIM6/NTAB) family NADH-FMN oxidoreductase RutF
MAPAELTPGALDRQRLRALYSSFPTGVTVVTTIDARGRAWGMTASSFYSISLEPPLVSISVTANAPSHNALVHSSEFAISILAESQAMVARQFATSAEDKFDGIRLEASDFTSPLIADATAWLVCRPVRTVEVGDHTLLIAEVVATRVHERSPLVYSRGTFSGLDAGRAQDVVATRQGLRTITGFIVEWDDAIGLVPDVRNSGGWSLPVSRLRAGRTHAEALNATAAHLFEAPIEADFLYSIVDTDDHVTCMVYRGSLLDQPGSASRVRWFGPEEIPWEELTSDQFALILRRYLRERIADQFGVYVNVGRGRIATITSEQEWLPTTANE